MTSGQGSNEDEKKVADILLGQADPYDSDLEAHLN